MGDFLDQKVSASTTHATRGRVAKNPLFFVEHFPSGSDNGRDRLIKAQSRLDSVRNYPRLQRAISRVLDVPLQILNRGGKWAIPLVSAPLTSR
jgi:hypothetical protein